MQYTCEFSIEQFEFWGDAVEVVSMFKEKHQLDFLETLIVDAFSGVTPSATDINNFVAYTVKDEINEIAGEAD